MENLVQSQFAILDYLWEIVTATSVLLVLSEYLAISVYLGIEVRPNETVLKTYHILYT